MASEKVRVNYTISIDKDLRNKFKVYCAIQNRFQNEVLEELITNLLNEKSSQEGVGEGDGNNNQ